MVKSQDLIPRVVVDANSCRYDIGWLRIVINLTNAVPQCTTAIGWSLAAPATTEESPSAPTTEASDPDALPVQSTEWTLLWCDTTIAPERLIGIKPFQVLF